MTPLKKINFILALSGAALPLSQTLWGDTTGPESLQADFSKTALPILQQSCFACHGPNPQDTGDIQDPGLRKKADKTIAKAQKNFRMAETFPFPESDSPKDDLKDVMKVLRKGRMPPKSQKELNLGQPLSGQDKKTLLDWAVRAQKGLD